MVFCGSWRQKRSKKDSIERHWDQPKAGSGMPSAKASSNDAPFETPRGGGSAGFSMCGQPRPSPVFVATVACAAEVENISRTATLQFERDAVRDTARTETTGADVVEQRKDSNTQTANMEGDENEAKVSEAVVEIDMKVTEEVVEIDANVSEEVVEIDAKVSEAVVRIPEKDESLQSREWPDLRSSEQRVDVQTEKDYISCNSDASACVERQAVSTDEGFSRSISTKIQETFNAVRSTISRNYESFTRSNSERPEEQNVVQQIEGALFSVFDKCTEVGESTMPCVFGDDYAEVEDSACPKLLIRMIVDTPAGPYVRFIPDALLQDAIDMGFVSEEEVMRQRKEWQEKYGLIAVQGSFAESLVASS